MLVLLAVLPGTAFGGDTVAPTATLTAPAAGSTVRNGQALTATASDAGGVANVAFRSCRGTTCAWANGVAIGAALTAAPYTLAWNGQPADGTYTLLARATDRAGNVGTSAPRTVTVDNAAPDTTLLAKPPLVTTSPSSTFTFSSEAGATFACSIDGSAFTACTSPRTYGLAGGLHLFAVHAIDRAGNVDQTPPVWLWHVGAASDTTPPDTAIGTKPAALTNATAATFSFTSEAGAYFACSLDGGAYAACASPKAYSGLANGTHAFSVRATDGAGNTDPSPASFTWVVDTVAPSVHLDEVPAKLANAGTARFAFSSEAGAQLACFLDGARTASCASPVTPSGLPDGDHTFVVQATDAAGNVGSAAYTWTVDTTAPETTIGSSPPALVASAHVTILFSSDDAAASFACSLDGGAYAACSSPRDLTGLGDGTHTFSVRATDRAGNVDQTSAQVGWTVDTTAPTVSFDAHPSSPTKSTGTTFDFSSEGGAAFECSLDGEDFYACLPPENVTGLADGAHSFAVRATDRAGNVGAPRTFHWTVDTTAPDSVFEDRPAAATTTTSVQLVFSSEAGAALECSLDGASFAACTSPVDLTGLADGEHTFGVRATDAAGNVGDAAVVAWTVDTHAPDTQIGARPSALAGPAETTIAFAADEASSFSCSLDGAAFVDCASPLDLGTLADGPHTFAVRATDPAGNQEETPATYSWTTDTVAPAVAITAPAAGATVSGLVVLSADVSDASGVGGVQFQLDGADLGAEDPGPAPYEARLDTTALANGPHTLGAVVRDAAANVTTRTVDVTVANEGPAPATAGLVAVGPGYVDATARQVVRTAAGRVYIVAVDDSAYEAHSGSAVLRAWKANREGVPTAFDEVDAASHPRPGASGITNIVGADLRLDKTSGIVHTLRLESSGAGELVYQTFDTGTDRWSSSDEDVATGVRAAGRGRETFALAVDAAGVPHVVYSTGSALWYTNRTGGGWSPRVELASGGSLLHPSLTFDALGNLHVAWLDDESPAVLYRERAANGTWTATDTVATGDVLTNVNADQGVSVAARADGTPYVLFVSGPRGHMGPSDAVFGAVRISYRGADGTWQSDDPGPELYAHTPQIYLHGDDVYAFLGHDIDGRLGYAVHQPGRPWSTERLLSSTDDGFIDGSASVRLDVDDVDPGVIDAVFYDEDKLHDGTDLPELYYRAVTPAEPAQPDTAAPSIGIDTPGAGSTVAGAVSVAASATDDVGVTSVDFQLDGVELGAADTTAPYSITWDSTTAADGTHVLTAVARDAAGNERTSEAVTVTVDNSAPVEPPATLFGSEDLLPNDDFDDPGFAEAFQVTAGADGTLRTLHVHLGPGSLASDVIVGIYGDDGDDRPGTLLTSADIAVPEAGAWNSVALPTLPIAAGTKYWVALLAPTGAGGRVTFQHGSGGLAVGDANAGSDLPAVWTTTGGPWPDAPLAAFGTS